MRYTLRTILLAVLAACSLFSSLLGLQALANEASRPNILVAISDDQSFPHASAYGCDFVRTPAFDRIAREGVLFRNAYCGSPGCSPSRAALLTGRYPWQLEQAGTHASSFPARYQVYPDLLEQAGYFVGFTGKGWGPGNWKVDGRPRNPAGEEYNRRQLASVPATGISKRDYAANFQDFLDARPDDRPFCFWYGAHEPHRGFEAGSGQRAGKQRDAVQVPDFLPDTPLVRDELLDYALEIEHFDTHLGRMLELLQRRGELDNTLVVVTSDNGMAFPRAKANCYEAGVHVPLAIRWPARAEAGRSETGRSEAGRSETGRVADQLVGFVDLAPSILVAAGLQPPPEMVGRDLRALLRAAPADSPVPDSGAADSGAADSQADEAIYSGRERHSSSRYENATYPQRAMRTGDYLLIRNFRPDRWPAGDPRKYDAAGQLGPPHGGYHDIDACPTLKFLIEHRRDPELGRYFRLAVDKRPAWELFQVVDDPACLNNLAGNPEYAERLSRLQRQLEDFLRRTGDPRLLDGGEVFETYKRYSPIRRFPEPPETLPE